MNERRTIDVSALPDYAFGLRSPMWWGTVGIMLIEGTVFAGLLATYFYLRARAAEWPPSHLLPDLRWGTLNLAILLVSGWPNQLAKKAAEREDLRAVRIWLVVANLFALAFIAVRFLEFQTLNCHWTDNAYASVVWVLLGAHTAHLVTDFLDTIVLTVLMFTGPLVGKRFVDVSENALYWWFVVASWVPIYATIYWAPRWLFT